MSGAVTIPEGTGLCHLPLELPLARGGTLRGAHLAFEAVGPADAPVVLVQGGISAGRHVAAHPGDPTPGWWEGIAGAGLALDTTRLRVLGIDWLGGAGASTGPANSSAHAPAFPPLTPADQARATALLLDHLGIDRLAAFVGASYGGMVGLAFAAAFEERLDRLVAISAPHEPHPMATAWRSVQRRIVALGRRAGLEDEALALARALAMTTYRSHAEFAARFADSTGVEPFPVERYLAARGADFVRRCDAEAFAVLSRAIDLHRVDPAAVRVPTTIVAATSDQLVPLAQLRDLHARLGSAVKRFVAIDSLYGHDAFLKETDAVGAVLREVLEEVQR